MGVAMAKLKDEEILEAFRGAFKPLNCKARFVDGGSRVKLTLRDEYDTKIYRQRLATRILRDRDFLNAMIEDINNELTTKGHKLDPRPK